MAEAGYDEATRRALRLLVVLSRAADAVGEHARRHVQSLGLSISEFGVLEMLHHKGRLPLGVVAKKLLLTTGSITYVIDQLEKKELVRRVACPNDRRVLYAELTDQGSALIRRIFPPHSEAIRHAVSGLSAEEQEAAAGLLKKLGLAAQAAL